MPTGVRLIIVGAGALDSPLARNDKKDFADEQYSPLRHGMTGVMRTSNARPYGPLSIDQRQGESKFRSAVLAGDGDILSVAADEGLDDVKA